MKRRNARKIVGIWLALGLISLASCAPITLPGSGPNSSTPAKVGSESPSASQTSQHFDSNAPVDNSQSTALTNFLHGKQLPLVGARVLASNGGPRQAILYGYVGTPFGKADAVDKTRQWLNDSGAQVDNRIKIEPDLVAPNAATAENNPDLNSPDIQKYEDQQSQQQLTQQRQYMNQGSPYGNQGSPFGGSGGGLMMMLPFLLGGSMGGGGSGFSFGGGGFGGPMGSSFGSPFGSPYSGSPSGSPYGSPSSPPPGYGSPYGP